MNKKDKLILVVSSPGGHLSVAKQLLFNSDFKVQFVVQAKKNIVKENGFIYVSDSDRDLRIFIQLFQALRIILDLKPAAIVSTGAGVAIPFFLLAKILNIRAIFIESASRTKSLSLSGNIAYRLVDRFYVRNSSLAKAYPKAISFE